LRGGVGERIKIPDGSITFAWGKVYRGSGANRRKVPVWRYIPPPWTQSKPETLYAPPIGAKNIDSSNPYTTVQMIGETGAPVPERIAIDLGITDAFVSGGGKSISFGGKGLETNVGETIPINTQGMTVNGGAETKGHALARRVYPANSFSATAVGKEEPVRGGVQEIRDGINRPQIAEDTKAMLEGDYVEPVASEPVEPKPKSENDISDLTTITDDEMDEMAGVSMADIWGEDTSRKATKKPVSRVNMRKRKPIRGQDNPIAIRQIRRSR